MELFVPKDPKTLKEFWEQVHREYEQELRIQQMRNNEVNKRRNGTIK